MDLVKRFGRDFGSLLAFLACLLGLFTEPRLSSLCIRPLDIVWSSLADMADIDFEPCHLYT